jgi:OFA family oxalate/formate antiporter-like MFS transporter
VKNPKFQLLASFIAMMMIGNLQYTWTLFVEPIRSQHTPWQRPGIQWAYTLYIAVQTWVQPFSGWFIDRIGQRPFVTVAGILCGLGWSLMGKASTLPELYFYYGMAGVGAAFVYSGSMGSALKWFPNRRGFASGVIAAGYGGGSAISVWIVRYLLEKYGYPTTFMSMGIFQGIIIAVVAQFLLYPDKSFVPPKQASAAIAKKSRHGTDDFSSFEMLATPRFYVLFFMFVAVGIGGLFLTASSGSMAKDWNLNSALTVAVSLGLVANAGSRPFWGWVSDKLGRENTMIVAFLLQAVFLVSIVTVGRNSPILFIVTMILTYFTWGEIYALFPATVGDYYGSKNATANNSILYAAKGVAGFVIVLPQMLQKQSGSWTPAFLGCAALALMTSLIALAIRRLPLPTKRNPAI